MTASPPTSDKALPLSPGNRTETVLTAFLFVTFAGFLFRLVSDTHGSDTLASPGQLLHWAAGMGIAATIVVTRTAMRRWISGFDWIFAAMWIVSTVLSWANGEL